MKLSRAEISLKRCTEQTHKGVTNDTLTFMASGYPSVIQLYGTAGLMKSLFPHVSVIKALFYMSAHSTLRRDLLLNTEAGGIFHVDRLHQ